MIGGWRAGLKPRYTNIGAKHQKGDIEQKNWEAMKERTVRNERVRANDKVTTTNYQPIHIRNRCSIVREARTHTHTQRV